MGMTQTQNERVLTDIWQFQAHIGRRLLKWGALSAVAGGLLALLPLDYWRGFGSQAAGWGAIDAVIGIVGIRSARVKGATPEAHTYQAQQASRRTLRRILLINAGLDVGYIAGGVALARTRGRRSEFWRGSGTSIVVQGGFLLLFDLAHAFLL
jgi:hypothetical protein